MSAPYKLLIHSANQIVQVVSNGETAVSGQQTRNLSTIDPGPGDGGCIVIGRDGNIAAVGLNSDIKDAYMGKCENVYDATNQSIIPGLVDGHTHPVWAGDRVNEFAMKLAGASYMEIHEAGGGINYTVEQTRNCSEDHLYDLFKKRLYELMRSGVTLAECKSGYGLDFDTEERMLRVINRATHDSEVKMDVSATYCGAHAIPKGSTAEEATRDIIDNQIPKLKALCDSWELHIDNIDVFCEKGVFDVTQSKGILEAGMSAGWKLNFHAEEFNCLHSVEMGAQLKASAMSHLEEISDEGIQAMAENGCVATVLPSTAYLLHLKSPPVRKMIESGVPVALGTDFNPNAYCLSMPMIMNLACVNYGMTMPQALYAATINAAASLGKSTTHGSIEVGKLGDLVVLDTTRWEHLIYRIAGTADLVKHVIKSGEIVYSKD
ncbi:probable imidazolonepropionase [Watersipora subatra]|uniref:probable imidazolonepropionase n=1 Tax=Watersipora subatra TaxID=2589382 RepID=UPI00355C234D